MSDGETVEDAMANGREAMLSWLDVAQEQGRMIPEAKRRKAG